MKEAWLLPVLSWATVFVVSPNSLKASLSTPGVIHSSLGNFGTPPYGSSLVGRVFYPEQGGETGCGEVDVGWEMEDTGGFLLVDRGGCGFGDKVWNGELAGARAVLILDDREELIESVIISSSPPSPVPSIPAFLLSQHDGQLLQSTLRTNHTEVVLRLHFEVRPSEKVELDLWYSANEPRSTQFFREFNRFGAVFTKTVLMVRPHFVLWECEECRDRGFATDEKDCVSGGRYCAPDPDGDGPRTGRDVLLEDLRQYCVFSLTSHSNSYSVWLSYLSQFSLDCAQDISASCSNDTQTKVNIDREQTEKCVIGTFYAPDVAIADNFVMAKELKGWRNNGPGYFPALLINAVAYMGAWEGIQVAKALCASCTDSPLECEDLDSVSEERRSTEQSSGVVIGVVIGAVVAVLASVAGYRWLMKRRMRKEVDREVREALAAYGIAPHESELAARSSG